MIDLRYLALTVIAVFLALAIGLMTGSALGSPDRTDKIYASLRRDFDSLREDNQRVRDENAANARRLAARDQAIRELLPLSVRDRLPGSRIAVAVCSPLDEGPFWNDLQRVIEIAGGEVGPVLHFPERVRPLSDADRQRLSGLIGLSGIPAERPDGEAAAWLVRAMATGAPQDVTEALARAARVDLRGYQAVPTRRLLLLTGAPLPNGGTPQDREHTIEPAMAKAAREAGMRLVAAAPEAGEAGILATLNGQASATVDCIDTPGGLTAAILALAGADGQFGTKPGATRALPPLDSP